MMRWLRVKLLMHFAPIERNPNTRLGLKLHKVQNVQESDTSGDAMKNKCPLHKK
jgi:hypothetical protein